MRLLRLWLTDFRCYGQLFLELDPGVTVVTGDNGQGKTTLVEAAGWLATGRSFRGVPDWALVRAGSGRALIRADVERGGRPRRVEVEIPASGRARVQVDGRPVSRGRLPREALWVTVFGPEDLRLVKGGPAERRGYLDELAAAISPQVSAAIHEYERVLRQRNALLRAGVRGAEERVTLEVWDERLSEAGAVVVEGRLRVLERLATRVAKAYASLVGSGRGTGGVGSAYQATWTDDGLPGDRGAVVAALREALGRWRARDIERGQTLVGPHRDEWRLWVGGLDARLHASQGEQRSLALALRLGGHAVVGEVMGAPPVLLLDDVFSELDAQRADALVGHLPDAQTVVTTTARLPPGMRPGRRFRVAAGRLEEA